MSFKQPWKRIIPIILLIAIFIGTGAVALTALQSGEENSMSQSQEVSSVHPDEWDRNLVYLAGDEVTYQGKTFQALRENQGEEPGSSGAWSLLSSEENSSTSISLFSSAESASYPSSQSNLPDTSTSSTSSPASSSSMSASSIIDSSISSSGAVTQAKPTPSSSPSSTPISASKKIVAYYPSWKSNSISELQVSYLTHVIYAFAIPTENGELLPLAGSSTARALIDKCHRGGVKVLLAVGGWSHEGIPLESTFVKATETEEKRTRLTEALLTLCREYGFDGINMDWEYPRAGQPSQEQYESLMVSLSKRLHEEGKLLTTAVIGGTDEQGHPYYDTYAQTSKVLAAVDWINIMAYDANETEHSSFTFAQNCLYFWRNTRGVPAGKLMLGVPFYGRPGGISYRTLIEKDSSARLSDSILFNGSKVWYNGESTIQKKAELAQKNAGGIMIWEITQDSPTNSLLQIIWKTLR